MSCGENEVLAVHGLTVAGPAGPIIRAIDFAVHRNEAVCVLGETGAGKSLIAQALFGLLPTGLAATGLIDLADGRRFDLAAPASLRQLWGRDMFLLPQEPFEALDPTARLLGQVAEAVPHADPALRRATAEHRLAALGLAEAAGSVPAALSGGMAQRALLAIMAAVPAPFVVADEPTKGLDPPRRDAVAAALADGCAQGRALLTVTHDLALPVLLGARVLVLHDGMLVEQGDAATVLTAPRHPWTRALLAAQPGHWPRRTAAPAGPPVLEARGLAFAWPGRPPLFDDVSLRLRPGAILAVSGPSGAGKSTLCDVLLGLHRPRTGAVLWEGRDVAALSPRARRLTRRRLQKLYQDPSAAFPPHRALGRVFADLRTVTDDPLGRLPALLDRLRLSPRLLDRRVGEISGGEAQRLALARALLLRPAVLLADEPTSRLDAGTARELFALLGDIIRDTGLAMLLVTHDAALADALADDKMCLEHGRCNDVPGGPFDRDHGK